MTTANYLNKHFYFRLHSSQCTDYVLVSCIVIPYNDILCILTSIDCTGQYQAPWLPIEDGLRIKSAQKITLNHDNDDDRTLLKGKSCTC